MFICFLTFRTLGYCQHDVDKIYPLKCASCRTVTLQKFVILTPSLQKGNVKSSWLTTVIYISVIVTKERIDKSMLMVTYITFATLELDVNSYVTSDKLSNSTRSRTCPRDKYIHVYSVTGADPAKPRDGKHF